MKNTRILVVLLVGLALTGCGKADEPVVSHTEPVAAAKPQDTPAGTHVKIIDVRKDGDCENQTLMEEVDTTTNYRYSRCAYFGQVGDTFWWVEKE